MNYLRATWFWFSFLILTAFWFTGFWLAILWCQLFDRKQISHAAHKVACLWGKSLFWITPGWSFSIYGKEHLPANKPAVFVANHQSSADIFVMLSLDLPFRWLSKDTVFKLPVIGQVMKFAGYVPVIRGNPQSHRQALELSHQRIEEGVSMVFFPEGSRSVDGRLKSFKTGAFRLAEAQNVPLIPVVLVDTNKLVKKNSGIPESAHVKIHILPATKQDSGDTLDDYVMRVRKSISEVLESTRPSIPNLKRQATYNEQGDAASASP